MPRNVRGALIQAKLCEPVTSGVQKVKQAMIDKHVELIAQAAEQGAQVCCLQELFYGPYFCAEQDIKWYDLTEPVPDGPTTKLMMEIAKKHKMVIVVPIYEEEMTGVYYNTAAVIDADGSYLGKFRKIHIPHCNPGFFEKFYFRPGNLGYPVFDTMIGKVGVYICYDRHFPDGARCFGTQRRGDRVQPQRDRRGPQRIPLENRTARPRGGQPVLRRRDQSPGHRRTPWNIGEFYGQSYFCDPRGQFIAQSDKRTEDDIVIADMDLDLIREVRNTWQFFRDRRPETYGAITEQ